MVRVRVPLVTGIGGLQARAPTFAEVPGSYQGDPLVVSADGVLAGIALGNPLLAAVTVQVDVPNEDATNGQLDGAKIKQRYPGHFLVVNHSIPGT